MKEKEDKRCKKNLFSPTIVYLKIDNASDSYVQILLDALGELNEEFLKAREEQKQSALEKNINTKFTERYSDIPIYVAIDERIKHFPSVFNEKKTQSSNQQKTAMLLQKDIERIEKIKNELPDLLEKKGTEIIIKETSDSVMKATVKGTAIFKIGENEITLSGDSVDVVLKKVLKANINSENWSYNLKH